jgi:hypothetical protein
LTLVITGRSVALMAELGSPAGVLVVGGGVAALESLMPGPAPEGFADLEVPLDTAEAVRG